MTEEKDKIETVRHSLSHVMAAAVKELFPEVKFGIGPAIENGFYYDFDLKKTLTPEDAEKIYKKMCQIITGDFEFVKRSLPKTEAIAYLEKEKQPYKVELAKEIADKEVSFYDLKNSKTDEIIFTDMCAGPHVTSTKEIGEVGIGFNRVAGAYWRGSEKNKMLQRIYFYAFSTIKEMEDFRKQLEEAEKRDHRKLGAQMDLFSFHEEGPGFPFWHPRGMVLWNLLLDWWQEEHKKAGYLEVKTPIILARALWEESGHWDHYQKNMYFTKIDDRDFAIKPMNCPGGILIYKNTNHSYKEFPIRMAEVGLVHRHEMAGVLHGLMRVRSFHQDDAHIYCLPEQIESEVIGVIDLIDKMYGKLGLKYHLELSTRPEEGSIGSGEMWKKAEESLKQALETKKIDYKLNPGDGAFYGPKIDFHIEDAIGRTWQTGTIQLDFAMPERFSMEYTSEDGTKMRPVMLHRVVFGSFERFIGILLEHFAGAFPVWLAPVQAKILPISDKHLEYAKKIEKELVEKDIRVEIDDRSESVGRKIRDAEMQKIPYMLIVGDKEIETSKVAVRKYAEGDKGQLETKELIDQITKE
jgi:threonyl-tRNA synthetase